MNSLRSLNWAVGIAMASMFATASTGLAAGGFNLATGHPVKSREEAEQLPVGSKVTLACAQCKTVWNTEVGKKKGFLAWFEPKTKHLCPGCGGYTTLFTIGRSPGYRELYGSYHTYYTHTCSICGANSAACYSNAPGHKVK
jgi:hypothetical protein